MALRQTARLFNIANRSLFTSSRLNIIGSSSEDLPSASNLTTGLEKKEALQFEAGNEDPYNMNVIKRGAGTKDKPTLVPSAFDSRIMGCICEEDAIHINWMWLHKGQPTRCMCGYWYQLVYKPPVE